jgi:NAD(P)-dependent dehydrogenase (short-subunit alcohol dehydrogenase family)
MGRREQVLADAVKAMKSEGIDAAYVQGDVRDYESVKKAVDATTSKFGRLGMNNCCLPIYNLTLYQISL